MTHANTSNHENDKKNRKIKVCYVLSYKSPNYIRTKALINALNDAEEVELHEARNSRKGLARYLQTTIRLLKVRCHCNPDIYIVGFRGHEIYWLVRLIAGKKPIIFDEMMSPSLSLIEEEEKPLNNISGKLLRIAEKAILKNADYIITDTNLHVEHIHKNYDKINKEKILAIPVGAVEGGNIEGLRRDTSNNIKNNYLTVLYYGSFLPLHGIDVIIRSAHINKNLPINYIFIGGNKESAKLLSEHFPKHSTSIYNHKIWVPYNTLIEEVIPKADLLLGGPFGGTPQALRVVTGKTSQALAHGKPTIIGEIDEDYGFISKENCILVKQQSPESLANAIKWAYENLEKLDEIGKKGYVNYMKNLSTKIIKERIVSIIRSIE
ncbi:hypothetical protein [uncultured Marinobacter sp.]|uniref:hypothetical protein n=1 Tax=uncultured Marinobacter sp. TaxID=187379 RepID=UPI0026080951|nr:hypothetical protein [uncultured Marinobacter sp.]